MQSMSLDPFEPLRIGSLSLKNRFVAAAMATRYPDARGNVTDVLLDYYAHLALLGLGMIVVEAAAISSDGRGWSRELAAWQPDNVSGLAQVAEILRERGATAILQLHHAGRQGLPNHDGTVFGPSAVPCPILGRPVRDLTYDEIMGLIDRFVDAAKMASQAGFQGVELHGAHGYLLHQFVSPLANFREDDFGIQPSGLSRFPLEIVKRIKSEVPGLFLSYRLSARDYLPSGLTLKRSKVLAKALEAAGVDMLSVSGGMYASLHGPHSLMGPNTPMTIFRDDSRDIRESVKIPIMVTGKIQFPSMAEEILENNDATLIGLGRMILRDPDWVQKARQKDEASIRTCLLCSRCHYHQKGCPDDSEKPIWTR